MRRGDEHVAVRQRPRRAHPGRLDGAVAAHGELGAGRHAARRREQGHRREAGAAVGRARERDAAGLAEEVGADAVPADVDHAAGAVGRQPVLVVPGDPGREARLLGQTGALVAHRERRRAEARAAVVGPPHADDAVEPVAIGVEADRQRAEVGVAGPVEVHHGIADQRRHAAVGRVGDPPSPAERAGAVGGGEAVDPQVARPLGVLHDHDHAVRRAGIDGHVGLLEDPRPGTVEPDRPGASVGTGRHHRQGDGGDRRPASSEQAPP